MRRRGSVLAAAAAVAAGCGGAAPADDFRERADRVCTATRAAAGHAGDARTLPGLATITARTRDAAREGVAGLHGLGEPPKALAGAWSTLLSAMEAQLPLLEQTIAAAKAADAREVERLALRGRRLERRAAYAARQAGLQACGVEPGVPGA